MDILEINTVALGGFRNLCVYSLYWCVYTERYFCWPDLRNTWWLRKTSVCTIRTAINLFNIMENVG